MIKNIVDLIRKSDKPSKTLILCKDLAHVELLRHKLNAYSVEGKDSIEDRYLIINKFIKDKK